MISDRSGGSRAAIGGARRLLVRERRREIIGRPAGPLEHLALVVRAVLDLVVGGERRRLRLGIAGTAGIGEVAERDVVQASDRPSRLPCRPSGRAAASRGRTCRTGRRTTISATAAPVLGGAGASARCRRSERAGEQRAAITRDDHRPSTLLPGLRPARRRRSNSAAAAAFRSGSSSGSRIRK